MSINQETWPKVSPLNNSLLDSLNPEQQQAVTCTEGPLVVFAGAGSGKTRVICTRIVYLIRNQVNARSILALTFTNKAANEMKKRVSEMLQTSQLDCLISTFHAACALLLRPYYREIGLANAFTIIDDHEQLAAIKSLVKELGLSTQFMVPKDFQVAINSCKRDGVDAIDYSANAAGNPKTLAISALYTAYEKKLTQSSQLDFGDLLKKFVQLLENNETIMDYFQKKFQYVLVDEYQDTNVIQNRLINLLAAKHHNLCIVGDDDQSIYSWRGAKPEFIVNFQKKYPKCTTIYLEQNYRSSKNIIEAASHVIANNPTRVAKNLWTENEPGQKIACLRLSDNYKESEFLAQEIRFLVHNQGVTYNQIAVFYRTNAQSRVLEEGCNQFQIPYRIYGAIRFFDRSEIRDLTAYLKVVVNPNHSVGIERILNKPPRGIGKTTLLKLLDFAAAHDLTLWQVLTHQLDQDLGIGKGAKQKLHLFVQLISSLMDAATTHPVSGLLAEIIDRTDYCQFLQKQDPETFTDRFENVQELTNSIRVLESHTEKLNLEGYLQTLALQTTTEESDQNALQPHISLMTLHMAKGLEYDYVFLVGAEDGLIPHKNSSYAYESLEEERRLFYVGMTRAKTKLYMTSCMKRMEHGNYNYHAPTPFFDEIPEKYLTESAHTLTSQAIPQASNEDPEETYIEYDTAQECGVESEGALIGRTVAHKTFGSGKILSVIPSKHGQKLKIYFAGIGQKTILASFLTINNT